MLKDIKKLIFEYADYTMCQKCHKLHFSSGYLLNGKMICIKCLLHLLNFTYTGLVFKNNKVNNNQ